MKKVYLIYEIIDSDVPYLFGYCKNKDDIDRFKEERNMDYYIIKELKISKEEIMTKRIPELKRRGLKTFNKEFWENDVVYLELTSKEEMETCLLKTDWIINEISKFTHEWVRVLNESSLNILNELCYFHFYSNKLINEGIRDDGFVNSDSFSTDILSDNYKLDELGIFIKLYGYKMKNKWRK